MVLDNLNHVMFIYVMFIVCFCDRYKNLFSSKRITSTRKSKGKYSKYTMSSYEVEIPAVTNGTILGWNNRRAPLKGRSKLFENVHGVEL